MTRRRRSPKIRFCSARCRSAAHYRANVDVVHQRSRAWHAANREFLKTYFKAWRQENRDRLREYFKAWRQENRDRLREAARTRYAANLDSMRARAKEGARQRRVLERQLRPLIDALVATFMGPLEHLVEFSDADVIDLLRLLRARQRLERKQLELQPGVH